jgi:hypothetical protein
MIPHAPRARKAPMLPVDGDYSESGGLIESLRMWIRSAEDSDYEGTKITKDAKHEAREGGAHPSCTSPVSRLRVPGAGVSSSAHNATAQAARINPLA